MKACATRLMCALAGDGTRPAHLSQLSLCGVEQRRVCVCVHISVVNAAHRWMRVCPIYIYIYNAQWCCPAMFVVCVDAVLLVTQYGACIIYYKCIYWPFYSANLVFWMTAACIMPHTLTQILNIDAYLWRISSRLCVGPATAAVNFCI